MSGARRRRLSGMRKREESAARSVPEGEAAFVALHAERAYGAGKGLERVEAPTSGLLGIVLDAEDPRRLTGDEGDVEVGQRAAQPIAHGLQPGFFARPAVEEPLDSLALGEPP